MKTMLMAICLFLFNSLAMKAQKLTFHDNGEFKIVQFTDLHYVYNDPRSQAALQCIDNVVSAEHPDLLIFTGDNIYSKPAEATLRQLLDRIDRQKVPFVMLFGNHDFEQGLPNFALYDIIRQTRNNIMPDRGSFESPDYALIIGSHDGKHAAAVLYCMDSHAYSGLKDIKGYDWIKPYQIEWYIQQSKQFTQNNGGTPLPALTFFHIPVPEFNQAASSESAILHGSRMETACAPVINSGLFTAMKTQGDVMGIFCGHDHDNDYTVMWQGILLGYGRFSGGNTEYNHLPNGARVIVLKEGSRSFRTWIRQSDGKVVNATSFPDSYVKDDWRARK